MLAVDMERISSFLKMCDEKFSATNCSVCSDISLDGMLVSLHLAKNERTTVQYIVGGGDDGSIAIWTMDLKLCARWIIFTTPLQRIAQFPDVKGEPLRGIILCISEDGTIAVVALDGFQFLYVVPGSPFPLDRVYLGADNLLLSYADQRVRLWDVRTREFWRSMSLDKAEELLAQGGWIELSFKAPQHLKPPLRVVAESNLSPDVARTLSLDLNSFISESLLIIKSLSTNKKQTRNIFMAREHLRSTLSVLLTPGLNQGIDEICYNQLGIKRANASMGFSRNGYVSLYHYARPENCWSLSGDVSAARALAIVAVLRALSVFEELSESASTVITFYVTGLSGPVGSTYKPPNLAFLARRWFESSSELRHSARLLFDAAIVRLSDEDTSAIVDEWQHELPCLQPTADKESALAALALFLCGYLAADKYSMLSTSALTDIAKSINMYLHDEHSVHRVLAIDLCSRGFHVWQHYIDALEILRSLFSLATNSKKENINAQNVGAQARVAILHIASTNTPLFMTTLGLDILNPASTEQRKSVMQIVAFLIKKRPLVLYPNLPKLMEAVVKSLDPNSTSNRDAVLDTATEILGHVVKTFPNVDFHMSSQRLAVGTSEGAMVMYDLKTAIRLYVLEGHKKRIAACSFSPDGRRLVTLSLEESVVLVWKVGSSFVSFFTPGAPPRQGHSGSDPFKTLSFNVGDAGNMTIAETLEFVHFDWPAERSVKLKIRDSILTFST
ncbi:WD40-repeat-containing domain protein [Rhodocollybia butyracea]|uniref:WD40-repeat-containing domain protein n=1 Tax=Rhodocollybia butyracea TaxID=206335 RepID=A0A9P5Q002_9AGAR|nr:WD40-repeat-containing domain protein [Rhodocollybia butyracea]